MSEEFDFESIKNKAIEQLKTGKPLLERMECLLHYWRVFKMLPLKVRWASISPMNSA